MTANHFHNRLKDSNAALINHHMCYGSFMASFASY